MACPEAPQRPCDRLMLDSGRLAGLSRLMPMDGIKVGLPWGDPQLPSVSMMPSIHIKSGRSPDP